MIIDDLVLKNFKRYRNQTFTFKDGITAIIGSNGSGKSSIMDGIVFALYGVSGSGIDADFVVSAHAGPKEKCEVRLTFSTGGERYTIVRSFRRGKTDHHDAQLHFAEDGRLIAKGVIPVRDAVHQILGMGPVDFRTTIYAPQRDLLALLHDRPHERKQWFMRALGIERIRDGSWEMIKTEIRALEEAITTLSGRLEEIDAKQLKIDDLDEQQKEEEYSGLLKAIEKDIEHIRLQEADNAADLERLRQKMLELRGLESDRANLQERVVQRKQSHQRLAGELADLENDLAAFDHCSRQEAYYDEIQGYAEQQRKAREAHLDVQVRKQDTLRRLHELRESQAQIEERLSLARQAEETASRLEAIPTERTRLQNERRALQSAQEAYYHAGRQLSSLESEIRVIREQVMEVRRKREDLLALEEEYAELNTRIAEYEGISELSKRCLEADRIEEEYNAVWDQISRIEADIRGLQENAAPFRKQVQAKDAATLALSGARSEAERIREQIALLGSQISHLQSATEEAERHLLELDCAGEQSPCPTCGHPLENRFDDARARLIDQIQSLTAERVSCEHEYSSFKEQLHIQDKTIEAREAEVARALEAEKKMAAFDARIGERRHEHERLTMVSTEKQAILAELDVSGLDRAAVHQQAEAYESLVKQRDEITYAIRQLPELDSKLKKLAERAETLFVQQDEVQARIDSSGYSEEALSEIEAELSRIEPLYEQYREALVLARERKQLEYTLTSVNGQIEQTDQIQHELSRQIAAISFDQSAYEEAEAALARAVDNHERYLLLKGRVERIPEVLEEIEEISREIKDEEAKIRRILEEIQLYASVPQELELIKREAEALADKKNRCDARIREVTGLLAGVREKRARIDMGIKKAEFYENERKNAISEKSLIESTGTILKQFAEHLIGSVRGRIEEEVGEILSQITDGRYEYVTIDSDFSIRVHEAGEDYPASRFSGGEQDDIAVALRIALSRHIAATHRIRDATVLIFDEIFGSQDEERRKHLIRALRKQEPYFPQILVISHIEGVQEECQTVIRVQEQPDFSSIALEVSE